MQDVRVSRFGGVGYQYVFVRVKFDVRHSRSEIQFFYMRRRVAT